MNALLALSPLDGRYQGKTRGLAPIFSEFGLISRRVFVEIEWLIALAKAPETIELPSFTAAEKTWLRLLAANFSLEHAEAIKAIEAKTNHDVKAVEYWMKAQLQLHPTLAAATEFVHFALTSEDVNNLAYALILKDARQSILLPELDKLIQALSAFAQRHAATPMLSRTHGQTASPTTLGKEFANVVHRLQRQRQQFASVELLGKCAGAVGNYNAHHAAYPEINWPAFSKGFVALLGLTHNPFTTQIEPHDFVAEYCDVQARICTILIDFARDIWGYVSLGYFKQALREGEVGSSTMPHKVNPIDFENAEGNLGIARALLQHFSEKLPISRWQRDLTDSTVLRSLGSAFGYVAIALDALSRGLAKLSVAPERLAQDLEGAWEVLAEAIQTVMRRYGLPEPYEQLKTLTRGTRMSADLLQAFVDGLDLPTEVKARLRELTPGTYTGLATELVKGLKG